MGFNTQRRGIKIICITGILTFLINLIPLNDLFADNINSSNLSPQLVLPQVVTQNDFLAASRDRIIDSYISDSLLTEFEYRALKLDIIFNTKLNPSIIEKQIEELVSKEDLLNYFSDIPYDQKRIETRLKIRGVFNAVLDQYGYDQFILPEYQDKIMEKLLEEHNKNLALSGEYVLSARIWKTVQEMTAEEILLFTQVPSSPEEHALKKKIKILISPGLREEGIVFNEKVWIAISKKIQARRESMLGHFNFYIQKYDKEFKKRLMDEVSMRDIAYYFADTAGYNYERQEARRRIYAFFMDWLTELDERIEQNPYAIRLFMVNEGRHWEARYNAALDRIIREMLEIDANSYELSVKKMLAQKIDKTSDKSVNRAIDIIVDAENKLLTLNPADYDLYHRIRAVNGSFERNFVYIDNQSNPVLYEGYGIGGRQIFVADNVYFVEQGSAVFLQTVDPKTGENEVLIFTQQAPYIEVKKIKNDYSRMFKDTLKAFIEENFSSWQVREIIAYALGKPSDWDKAYNLSVKLNNKCEQFFWQKFKLKLNKDAWQTIFEVMQEFAEGKNTLTQTEAEFIRMSLPFSPKFNGLMRLTRRDYGILPLSRGQLFELNNGQLQIGNSI